MDHVLDFLVDILFKDKGNKTTIWATRISIVFGVIALAWWLLI